MIKERDEAFPELKQWQESSPLLKFIIIMVLDFANGAKLIR